MNSLLTKHQYTELTQKLHINLQIFANTQKYPFANAKIQKYKSIMLPGRGGAAGAKFRISLACPVGAVMNCADNTG